MAPLPPVPNAIKVQLGWYIDNNDRVENVLHFLVSGGPPSSGTCAALAADIQAAQITEFKASTHTSNGIMPCTVTDISSGSGLQGVGGTATGGSLSGSYNGASVAMVINHHIARRYRGGKPRSYLPLGNQGALSTPGQWISSYVTTQTTNWANFITTCLASSSGGVSISAFVSVSYFHSGSVRVTPVVDTVLQSTARQQIGSQRRRIKGA